MSQRNSVETSKDRLNHNLKFLNKLQDQVKQESDSFKRIRIYEKYLAKGSSAEVKLRLFKLNDQVTKDERVQKAKELDLYLTNALEEAVKNGNKNDIFRSPEMAEKKDMMIIQDKKRIVDNVQQLSKEDGVHYLEIKKTQISGLSNDKKIKLLKCLDNQSDESSISELKNYYIEKLESGKVSKSVGNSLNKFLYDILWQLRNTQSVRNKLNSILEGGMQYTGERWLDTKGNLDVSMEGVSDLNGKAWDKTKDTFAGLIEKFKDAPNSIKGLAILGGVIAYQIAAGFSETAGPRVKSLFKYAALAFGGFVGINMLSDKYERYGHKDYVKTNARVKGYDFAKFFAGKNYEEQDVKAAEALLGNMYNPKVYNLEFAELINKYKQNKADSAEWVNFIDGKDTDVVDTHNSMKLIVNRYDPSSKSEDSIFKDSSVSDVAKEEIKNIWKQAMVEKNLSKNELSLQDVLIRLLAIDPKFTFDNERYLKQDALDKVKEYKDYQDKVYELERLHVLDLGFNEKTEEFKDNIFVKAIRGITTSSALYRLQGKAGNLFVNVDSISNINEFDKYKKLSQKDQFNVLPKRVSFMGDEIKVGPQDRILLSNYWFGMSPKVEARDSELKQLDPKNKGLKLPDQDNIGVSDFYTTKTGDFATEIYNPSITIKDMDRFKEDFKIIDRDTGLEFNMERVGKGFDVKTMPNGEESPILIKFHKNIELQPKRAVKLKDYVFYSRFVSFI